MKTWSTKVMETLFYENSLLQYCYWISFRSFKIFSFCSIVSFYFHDIKKQMLFIIIKWGAYFWIFMQWMTHNFMKYSSLIQKSPKRNLCFIYFYFLVVVDIGKGGKCNLFYPQIYVCLKYWSMFCLHSY